MKKELVIAAKFDTSDFDKSVETMQKKLKDLYAPADMVRAQTMQQNMMTGNRLQQNGMGGLDGASMEAFKKATQAARRELDQLINQQVKSQNGLGKELNTTLDTLKKLRESQKAMVSGSEEELKVKKQIAEVEKTTWAMREQFKNRDQSINQLLDAKEKNSPKGIAKIIEGYQNGGVSGAAGAAGKMFSGLGPAGMVGMAGAAIGGAGALMGVAANGYREYSRTPLDIAKMQGSAVANTSGKDLGNIYSGRSAFEGMWQDERQRAAGRAMEAMKASGTADRMGLFGNMMKWGGAGMSGGALTGAAIGSVVPGFGTAVGAGVGGAIGGLGGAVTGLLRANPNERDLALSSLPFIGERFGNRRNARLASQAASDYSSSLEDEKNMNPLKKMAQDDFEKNMMRNLNAQRAMGLTNDQFNKDGGYLDSVHKAGFTSDMGINASNEILGSGGSARMAKDSSFSLQMQRMGVTNAGSVLGSLSGSMQNPESTKRATIAIMSEAMKIGLDNSDFSEENRRFTQAAANIISRTGASGEGDQDRISGMLSQFMMEKTNAGVGAAQSAYEQSQSRGSQLDGRRGTMRMVEAMKNPTLAKLGQNDLSELLGTRPEDLNENNPELASFARKAGVSTKDIVDAVGGVNKAGRYELPGQRKEVEGAASRVDKYRKENGLSKQQFGDLAAAGKLPQDVMADYGDLQIAQRRTEAGAYNRAGAAANAGEALEGDTGDKQTLKSSIKTNLDATTRREDKFVKSASTDEEVVRTNFNKMSGEIDNAATVASKATTAFRQMAIELAAVLEKTDKGKNTAPIEEFLKKMAGGNSSTQTQATRSKQ